MPDPHVDTDHVDGADTSIGSYLMSLQATSNQKCVASLRRALAGSAPDSQAHAFAQRLLTQLGEGTPAAAGPSNQTDTQSVNELWERAHAMSVASGAGRGDELMKALAASDERDAQRRHRSAYDITGSSSRDDFASLFDRFSS